MTLWASLALTVAYFGYKFNTVDKVDFMSAPIIAQRDCCTTCEDITVTQVPGPAGANGTNGTNGTNGVNAFTTLSAGFTMPALAGTAVATVVDSTWASIGQIIYMQNCGWLKVTAKSDGTHMTLQNVESATAYTENVAPGTVIAAPATVSPGGLQGPAGAAASGTLNDLSPTTTKGDLIVDNGANTPNANDVRFAVGTDGKELTADSTQATGMAWKQNLPNAATDNGIPRFDGASGTPIPMQTSKVVITDNGAIQASGSGGNARGTDAIDLQITRIAATQVASGTNSGVISGANNTASGARATVAGGGTNIASNTNSYVGGGTNNTASGGSSAVSGGDSNVCSGSNAAISGGTGNTASGVNSFVGGGSGNTASATDSAVLGGSQAKADKVGQVSFSAGQFAAAGDSQVSYFLWRIATNDATAGVEMFLDGGAARAVVPVDTSWHFDIKLVGRSSAGVDAIWTAVGLIHNNGGTTAMTCAATVASVCDGTGGSWGLVGSFAVTADNPNSSLKLAVTGAGATNIRWTAHARVVEVHY